MSDEAKHAMAIPPNEPILLDPPNWPDLSNGQLGTFVESVNSMLDYGIFRPPLAAELVRYRDAASDEISARIARRPRGLTERM